MCNACALPHMLILHTLTNSPMQWCRDSNCPKNHVYFYTNRNGTQGHINVVHHKYGKYKGSQIIPLAPKLIKMFGLLEQANATLSPKVSGVKGLWGLVCACVRGAHSLTPTPSPHLCCSPPQCFTCHKANSRRKASTCLTRRRTFPSFVASSSPPKTPSSTPTT